MTTIAEYLRTQFGERATFVEGFDHPSLGGSPFNGAEFCVGEHGINMNCSGPCIISFASPPTSFLQAYIRTPCPIYLIYDDSAGRSWDARRERGEVGYGSGDHSCRPNATLRLVQAG